MKEKMTRNNYKIYREILLNLVDNKCMNCNSKSGLSVHHIDENDKNNNTNNILILCRKCHGLNHGIIQRIRFNNINFRELEKIKERIPKKSLKQECKSKTCKICGKVIEGYSQKHVDYLMLQHNLVHRNEDKEKKDEKRTK